MAANAIFISVKRYLKSGANVVFLNVLYVAVYYVIILCILFRGVWGGG